MKKSLIAIGIPPTLGVLGALTAEYVLKIGVLGTGNLKYFLIAGLVGAIVVFILTKKMSLAVPTVIGWLLMPYFAFFLGQIDFYMVDDNLAQGVTVREVRPTMDKISFGTPDRGEVAVWSGPQTLKLHPGENRVKLGRFDMPAGKYQGGTVVIGNIEVDIDMDLAAVSSPDGPGGVPADKYAEVFETIKTQMQTGTKLVSATLAGSLAHFTISVGQMTQNLPIPEISYPGLGGPDITLDITLGPDGRPDPAKIRAIVDLPPGIGPAIPQLPGVEFK